MELVDKASLALSLRQWFEMILPIPFLRDVNFTAVFSRAWTGGFHRIRLSRGLGVIALRHVAY